MNRYLKFGILAGASLLMCFFINTAQAAGPIELWSQQSGEYYSDLFSGGASYQVPIETPAGRSGVEPSLSLYYSSLNSSISTVGYGWDLPETRIVRRPITSIQDMYDDGAFALEYNGQYIKLIDLSLTSGEYGTYGAEVEGSFFIITFNSDDSWTVESKDGVVMTLGAGTDSRVDNPVASTQIYAWYIDEARDTSDNFISYTYYKDGSVLYPSTIDYTGNGTTDGPFTVRFEPFASGTPSIRSDVQTIYDAGFALEYQYLIESIEVDVESSPVKIYDFVYVLGDNGYRSLLESVTVSGLDSDGGSIELEPYEFTYTEATDSWTRDDGSTFDMPTENFAIDQIGLGDFTGDGMVDILHLSGSSGSYTKQMSQGSPDGFTDVSSDWTLPDYTLASSSSIIADLNNDGLADFARSDGGAGHSVYLNTGENSFDEVTSSWVVPTTFDFDQSRIRFGDVNGDGLIDIVYLTGCTSTSCTTAEVWELDGETGWYDVSSEYSLPIMDFGNSATYLGDLNNDGLADIYRVSAAAGYYVYLNNGDGTWIDVSSDWDIPAGVTLTPGTTYTQFDINGDGFLDFYRASSSGIYSVWFGNSQGWEEDTSFTGFAGGATVIGLRFGDFNGDGLQGGMYSTCSTGCTGYIYEHDGEKPDILESAISPSGGATEFSYLPSTQFEDDDGDLANDSLSMVFPVVESTTTDDGLGNEFTTTYSYREGAFSSTDIYDGRFAGFGQVVETYGDGASKITYYHQGGGYDGETLGEFADDYNKIGRAYRTEVYDTSGTIIKADTMRIKLQSLSGGRELVHNNATVKRVYNSDGTHRDHGIRYFYKDGYGNLTKINDFGEVEGTDAGFMTDIGDDQVVTLRYYDTSVTSPYLVGNIIREQVESQDGDIIGRTRWYYDADGDLIRKRERITDSVTHGIGNWEILYYTNNAYGNIATFKDANRNRTTYGYDSWNLNIDEITDALGYVTSIETDLATGQITQTVDSNGVIEEWDYDSFGRLEEHRVSSVDDKAVLVTLETETYDISSVPNSIYTQTFLDSSTTHKMYEYFDGFGRLIQTRSLLEDGNYSVTDYEYDDRGNNIRTSIPYSDSGSAYTSPDTSQPDTDISFDRIGRTLSIEDSVGTVSYSYEDLETSIIDEQLNQKTLAYDIRGNLIRVDEIIDGTTYQTTYTYDVLNNLIEIEDADGNIREFAYDWFGRRLSATDLHDLSASYGAWEYDYDDVGNLTELIDPNGNTITYEYDILNRIESEDSDSVSGIDVTYIYDTATNGIGKLASVERDDITTSYSYNDRGGVSDETIEIDIDSYTTSYDYDYQNNITQIDYPGGSSLTQTYNQQGLIESAVFDTTDVITDIDYSVNGQATSITYGNGVTTIHDYDDDQRFWRTDTDTTYGSVALQDLNYTYDNVGNITDLIDASDLDTAKSMSYTYDDLYRLTDATSTGSTSSLGDYSYSYAYDAIGNMTSHPVNGTLGYTDTSNPHALISIGSDTWTYDDNGNVSTTGDLTLDWTYRNELESSTSGSDTTTYEYDQSGTRRVKIDSSGNETHYIGSYIYNTNDGSQEWHVSMLGDPVFEAKDNGSTTEYEWIHTDHLGGVAVTTDSSGVWTTAQDSYPFGDQRVYETSSTELDNRYSFTNKERDEESDLMYFEARYLDTDTARFMSMDPWEGDYTDPQSLNKYAYARNNPVRYIDPLGLWNSESGEVERGDTLNGITNQINEIYETSYTYNEIAKLNEVDDPNVINVGQVIMPNNGTPDVTSGLRNMMHEYAADPDINNPLYFWNKFDTGGDWDLKSQPGIYCSTVSCGGQEYLNYVIYGNEMRYDAPGNILYGYVGSGSWFGSPSILHHFAGNAQNRDNDVKTGDDSTDAQFINFGINLKNKGY